MGVADSNWQGELYAYQNYGAIRIEGGRFQSGNPGNTPFFIVNGGAPIIADSTDFSSASANYVFHIVSKTSQPNQLRGYTNVGSTPLTDVPGQALIDGAYQNGATTLAGTSGHAYCNQDGVGGSARLTGSCKLVGHAETGSAQTYTFPVPYTANPVLMMSGGSCGSYNPTVTTTALTLPANPKMTAESCNIMILGQ